jgi:pyruvate/2-oxoglutarate/acetoin dehydrogenase E1 component
MNTPNAWHRNHLIRDAIYRAIEERMRAEPTIMILGEGAMMKVHFDAPNIERDFKDRVLTLPITEDGNLNFCVGLAIAGCKPICNIITSDFALRAMDSICNTVTKTAYCDKPRTIVIQAEFMTGGPTTGQRLEGFFTRIPGLNVVVPSNPRDAYGLMLTALQTEAATVFFEDRMIEDATTNSYEKGSPLGSSPPGSVPFGLAETTYIGAPVTVVSYGLMFRRLRELARRTDPRAYGVELIDLRTLYTLDVEAVLRSTERTGKLLVVEPDVMFGGIGAELIAQVVAQGRPVRTERLGAPRATLPASRELHERYMPSDDEILEAIESLCR